MDQTTPNYGIFSHNGGYSSGYPEYFPPYVDPEYDSPPIQFISADPIYQQINDPCSLPDSPPDSNLGMIPMSYPQSMPQYPGVYAAQMNNAAQQSGAINVPGKKSSAIHHPSFPYAHANKRVCGSSTHSSSTSSPLSTESFKQEDEMELPYVYNSHPLLYNPTESCVGSTEENHRNIEFKPVFKEQWNIVVNNQGEKVTVADFKVQADKGFNFSQADEAFICQKKNHFQVTIQIGVLNHPHYIQVSKGNGESAYEEIRGFCVDLFGVKTEAPDQSIKIEQSQSDRSRKPFVPHILTFPQLQQQFTIGRLHFSETTANNMRKKGKPNPDQRYFRLVVALYVETLNRTGEASKRHLFHTVASENIIVRASNPGQFENDTVPAPAWQKAPHEDDAIFHVGNIGINNERPEEALDIRGNMRLTGRMIQPSDGRAKDIIEECDSRRQLENIRKLRIYRYKYKDEAAKSLGITGGAIYDTGIIAQEVLDTIPEAVEVVGDVVLKDGETIENFLMVNKDRLFMENIGAVKELTMITDNYANRISKLERLKAYLKNRESFRSYISSTTARTTNSGSSIYGMSASARPSIYGISDSRGHRPHYEEKPPVISKSILGKNFVQWLTLGLVILIAIVLIAMLSAYFVSISKQDTSDTEYFSSTVSFFSESLAGFRTTTINPELTEHDQLSTAVSGLPEVIVSVPMTEPTVNQSPTRDSGLWDTTDGTFVNINPNVVNATISFWDSLFETGNCSYILPISVDKQCVLNATYAAIHAATSCRVWNSGPYNTEDDSAIPECCSALLQEDFLAREITNYPEYISDFKPALPKNLQISFKSKDVEIDLDHKKQPRGKGSQADENQLVRSELQGGQAVLYRPLSVVSGCIFYPINPEGFSWGLLENIILEEPNITLNGHYCYSIKQPCGYNNTYTITLPLSRYYTVPHMTVAFFPRRNNDLVTCGYMIHGQGCYTRLTPAVVRRGHHEGFRFSLPVYDYAQSELQVRLAPSDVVQKYGNQICDMELDSIYKYHLVFSRSCK